MISEERQCRPGCEEHDQSTAELQNIQEEADVAAADKSNPNSSQQNC